MSGPDDGWAARVSGWAQARADIRALVQIGSRVQAGAAADRWSDYDYHLITTRPDSYRDGLFSSELGPCWACGTQVAFGNAVKVTAVYEGALEADFVVLRHVEVAIAMLALRFPATSGWWPRALREGVTNLRIVAAPGWKVIKGGAAWERRYSRITPVRVPLSERDFNALCGEFWTQLVWASKKASRGEFRSSQRALHLHLVENSLRVLQEEALLEGRRAHPLGRRAEDWLVDDQLRGTDIRSGADRAGLVRSLEQIADVFGKSAAAVAARHGWSLRQPTELRAWLSGTATGTGKAQR